MTIEIHPMWGPQCSAFVAPYRSASSLFQKVTFERGNTTGNRTESRAYELLVQGGCLSVGVYFFTARREVGELQEDTPQGQR
jgi:hypothetical protein